MRRLLILAALVFALDARAVTIDWVPVGNPGNAPDTATNCWSAECGSVPYPYAISKYEITNAHYAEFLNGTAASDPLGLYNENMASYGVTQDGLPGSYTYALTPGFEIKPVNFVSFYDALRFVNWLSNGQGSADTETGSYTITAEGIEANSITRNPGASIFLPSESEAYKAAYYDALSASYLDYPAGSNAATTCTVPGVTPNTASCALSASGPTDVGAYTASPSPYGTFDQGGNAWEWNEEIVDEPFRAIRGGSWGLDAGALAASYRGAYRPETEDDFVGFRVASLVPEPGAGLLGMTAVLGLAAWRKRIAKAL